MRCGMLTKAIFILRTSELFLFYLQLQGEMEESERLIIFQVTTTGATRAPAAQLVALDTSTYITTCMKTSCTRPYTAAATTRSSWKATYSAGIRLRRCRRMDWSFQRTARTRVRTGTTNWMGLRIWARVSQPTADTKSDGDVMLIWLQKTIGVPRVSISLGLETSPRRRISILSRRYAM